jgi:hypothetical protein
MKTHLRAVGEAVFLFSIVAMTAGCHKLLPNCYFATGFQPERTTVGSRMDAASSSEI